MPGEAAQENAARIAREQAARAAASAAALEQSRIVAASQAAAVKVAQEAATVAAQKTATTYETEYARSQSEYAQSQFDKYTTAVNENIVTIDSNLAQYHRIEKLNEWGKYDWSKYPGGKSQYIADMESQKALRSQVVNDYKTNQDKFKASLTKPKAKTKTTEYYVAPSGFKYPTTQLGQEAAFTEANKDLAAAIKSDKFIVTYTVNGKTEKKTFTTKQQADDFLNDLPSAKTDTSWIYTTPKGVQSTGGAKGLSVLGVSFTDRSALRGKEARPLNLAEISENIGKIGEAYENIFRSVTSGARKVAKDISGLTPAATAAGYGLRAGANIFDVATFKVRPQLWANTANLVGTLLTPSEAETKTEYRNRIEAFVEGDIADPADRKRIVNQLAATLPIYPISEKTVKEANATKKAIAESIVADPTGFLVDVGSGVIALKFFVNVIPDLMNDFPVKYANVKIPLSEGGEFSLKGIYLKLGRKVNTDLMTAGMPYPYNIPALIEAGEKAIITPTGLATTAKLGISKSIPLTAMGLPQILGHGISGEEIGYMPSTAIEVTATIKAMKTVGYDSKTIQFAVDGMALGSLTSGVKSKFIENVLPTVTRTMSAEQVTGFKSTVLDNKDKIAFLYGSAATAPQLDTFFEYTASAMGKKQMETVSALRLPGDWDIQMKVGVEESKVFAANLVKALNKFDGPKFRIDPSNPLLLVTSDGHAVDIHARGEEVYGTVPMKWSFELGKPTTKIEGIPVMSLWEQEINKLGSILGFDISGKFRPVAHRTLKDIADYFQVTETELNSMAKSLNPLIRAKVAKGRLALDRMKDYYKTIALESFITSIRDNPREVYTFSDSGSKQNTDYYLRSTLSSILMYGYKGSEDLSPNSPLVSSIINNIKLSSKYSGMSPKLRSAFSSFYPSLSKSELSSLASAFPSLSKSELTSIFRSLSTVAPSLIPSTIPPFEVSGPSPPPPSPYPSPPPPPSPKGDEKKGLLPSDKERRLTTEKKPSAKEEVYTVTFTDYGGRVEVLDVKAVTFREAYMRAFSIRRWHGRQHIVELIRRK